MLFSGEKLEGVILEINLGGDSMQYPLGDEDSRPPTRRIDQ